MEKLLAETSSIDHVPDAEGRHWVHLRDGTKLLLGRDAFWSTWIVYRAVDRAEYWRLVRMSPHRRAAAPSPTWSEDGLAPGEDPRRALTLLGLSEGGWCPKEGPVRITFPHESWLQKGVPTTTVIATRRGPGWPEALGPGEWRPFSG